MTEEIKDSVPGENQNTKQQEKTILSQEPVKNSPPPFYVPAATREKELPPRRVGTITMGLCLIVCGVGLCAYLIYPFENMGYLLRFAPLVLVGLGLEILISNAFSKNRKLKYDFLSIFISLILIGSSICATAFSVWIDYFSPQNYRQGQIVQDELYSTCYDQLKDQPIDSLSLKWSTDIPYFSYDLIRAGASLEELKTSSDLYLSIDLKGIFESREEFSEAVEKIEKRLKDIGVMPGKISFYGEGPSGSYQLFMDGRFQQNFSASEFAEKIIQYDENGERSDY